MLKTTPKNAGFTVIEMLIVIVVIALLATISFLTFRGIKEQADKAAIQSELKQAGTSLDTYRVAHPNELYPDNLSDVNVKDANNRSFAYGLAGDNKTYCLSNSDGTYVYYITNQNKIPAPGICDGSTGVPGTGSVALDMAPSGSMTVAASSSELKFTWNEVTCPGGLVPGYRWNWQVVGGSSGEQSTWTTAREQTVSPEGARVTGTIYARCGSGGVTETSSEFDVNLAVLTAPTVGTINIASDSVASWSGSGCSSGTSLQYRWQRDTAREAGSYNAYTSWATGTSSSSTIGYDDQVTYQVQARCTNTTSGVNGPSASRTSGTFTRGIPAPGRPTWIQHVVSNNLNMSWYAPGCSAGYQVSRVQIIRRSTGALTQDSGDLGNATSWRRGSLPVASWDSYVFSRCQGTYTSSGWGPSHLAQT